MEIVGKQFIDGKRVAESGITFSSYDAATGEALPYTFFQASESEVRAATSAAFRAFGRYRNIPLEERALFLETIAAEIDALDDEFVRLVMRETGLPEARIRGERLRTTNQLRLFATVVRRGDFLGARIDTALPKREPLPRPDIRQYQVGVGPVAVFGASNFPLAFSVAGGDTASALAAGCPVVVKAHSGHSATAEMVGQAITRAVERSTLPAGVFGMVFGAGVGRALVLAPEIKAVGFTGSLPGGRALCDLAASRPDPIPVFAEMSSINPVILMPQALKARGAAIAAGLAGSVTLGAGQFCTNPGLVIGFQGEAFEEFAREFARAMESKPPAVMLNSGTLQSYLEGLARMESTPGVERCAAGPGETKRAHTCAFRADARLLSATGHPLEEEVFGPSTVLVALENLHELVQIVPTLNGQLTASLFAEEQELAGCGELLAALEHRVGRLILNDYPTGVEVCDAMVHGGPYPATSDSRGTSVGTLAIDRYLRPVCYQGYPDQLLPLPLQDANPLGLRRLVNGQWSEGPVPA
ncbi:2,5-dioxovalerate dehydrogenase [Geomonas limicola]|uniref:2,5-dioxovalerate dehydrogenase n=1 Tax=Geomonas limicola TaxID=2740186 RepID=A0A6V8N3K5_9BACT|nr:aldehyde dehydrogenase (NADP(+)) [Geomonas limicola]GFO67128.1 2,5-dioxovalerate dehydrogenase [Geomonas limicola]